ncbi:MAG: hypothetical protein HN793_06200 [Rhodospirillaceae bacterium]|jgi:hypothetical protein|nr:hypothetical protein [Rhodospirillaceae bacterium]MBT6960460.1 hypothetical protein [Rhodospirillaceae bacterium]MBT7450398.1 hypothetical protein [Rhodospirillaceae bacterium]
MKEQHAIVKLSKKRQEPTEATQRGFTVVIGAHSLDMAIVREVHWLAKESGAPLTVYMVAPTTPWISALITPQA